ncbi:MAG: hypothetical protein SGJ20_21060 [Planctomycetota bacterium]|nr:hypothetical protein [Planctomycetota bacterium]
MNFEYYSIERRNDGAVVVRIASQDRGANTLPSAVFAFRNGDPQYKHWEQILLNQEQVSTGGLVAAS